MPSIAGRWQHRREPGSLLYQNAALLLREAEIGHRRRVRLEPLDHVEQHPDVAVGGVGDEHVHPGVDQRGGPLPGLAEVADGRADEYAQLALQIMENDYLNGETIRIDGALRFPAKPS